MSLNWILYAMGLESMCEFEVVVEEVERLGHHGSVVTHLLIRAHSFYCCCMRKVQVYLQEAQISCRGGNVRDYVILREFASVQRIFQW